MDKKNIAYIVIIILIAIAIIGFGNSAQVNIHLDGENATVSVLAIPLLHDTGSMDKEILKYALNKPFEKDSNITNLKEGIQNITKNYGFTNVNVVVDSSLGKDMIPLQYEVQGESMEPTLKNGEKIIVEKTKNISEGDIVACNSEEYGMIVKRCGIINGSSVYLVSDNKNVTYETINGQMYETKGLTIWVDIDDIYGVVKK